MFAVDFRDLFDDVLKLTPSIFGVDETNPRNMGGLKLGWSFVVDFRDLGLRQCACAPSEAVRK